ncbi:hypothetical protein EUX98_g6995 [Antrodiella citrinella]|uniref:Piwi domain-containing protein n=1 Tax=Antrodiella citrinella TaxID=2447956 RepID=A0A4S4MMN5_9APHY|nr:hypothetical protein EUX98_g6995 [Antrodiella citrinella]
MDRGRGRGGRGGGRGSPSPGSDGSFRGRGGPPRGGFDRGGARGGFRGGDRGGGRGRGGGPPRAQGGVFAAGVPATIDARLTDTSQDQIVASLRSLKLQDTDLPIRPDFGTVGKAIKLRTNFFPVKVPKGPLYEYEVTITPATTVKRLRRRIFQLAENTTDWANAGMTRTVAHDHASKLIAARSLPQPLEIKVPFTEEDEGEIIAPPQPAKGGKPGKKGGGPKKPQEYVLTINFVQELETESLLNYLSGHPQYRGYDIMPIVSALNLILQAHPNRSTGAGVMVGRNKFFHPAPNEPPFRLGGGLEAWRGFYSSVRPAHKQLMVNVNVCTTAFYVPGNLAERLQEFMNSSFGARASAFVRGVRIRTTHLGYRKTVKDVAKVNAKQHSFDAEGMGKVTVEQYFKRKYDITLRYPDMPLINVGGQKANLIPAELCEILEKQPFKGRLLDTHTAEMIRVACQPPNVNAEAIVGRGLQELGFRQNAEPLGTFGVSIGSEMAVVPGRILPSPNIRYASGAPRVDERASWNLRDVRFAVGATLSNWGVLLIDDGSRGQFQGVQDPSLRQVITGFMNMCRTSGMQVPTTPPQLAVASLPRKDREDPIRKKAIATIRTTLMTMKPKPTLVLVILADGDKHVYSGLKHLCDVYLDLPTVCVQVDKIRKEAGQVQYFANVALKVNMKMGGVNHTLDQRNLAFLKQQPTMLVGMDVTHPGFGTVKGTPSIAAIVASNDSNYGQFPSSMRIQESKKEMITDLKDMMVERIEAFKAKNNVLPARIIVYRDGVSEGQFHIVVMEEMLEIKLAFRKFSTPQKAYSPKLTIVICGKRHHTRFYPTEAENADRNGNPRPGTVVDRGVTAVYEFDFFLQGFAWRSARQTRPTHYYVVHDEIGFNANQLQGLTNDVSYMFARATKAVSLASPAYYADLACERGRCYLHALLSGISDSGTTATSGAGDEAIFEEAKKMWRNGVSGRLMKESMYYL